MSAIILLAETVLYLQPRLDSHSDCERRAPARRWAGMRVTERHLQFRVYSFGGLTSRAGAHTLGDHHERTNRTAIHFSSKAALACCNGFSYSIAGKHAANLRRSRSDRSGSRC
jgi:hypothetical protein